jgi:hypothetical protein
LSSQYEVRTASDWALRAEENIKIAALQPHKIGWLLGHDKLIYLHSKWIHYIWESNEDRALQAFRGSYKTTAVIIVGTLRWMLFHPNDRILLTRKSFNATAEVVRSIAEAMETTEIAELFKQAHGRYPKTKINREGNLTYNFKSTISPEGNITGKGINQDLTGRHYDKIINDDIITIRDRVSRAEREHTNEVIMELATNIKNPGKGSGWIGTPWHRKDGWRRIRSFTRIAQYSVDKYNFLGEEVIEKKKKTTTPYLFAANYKLKLEKDESLLFSDPTYSKGWDLNIKTNVMAQVDAAYDGDCYCALTIAAPISGYGDDRIYQAIGFCFEGHISDWYDEIVRLCRKYNVTFLYEETNADKGMSVRDLTAKGLKMQSYSEGHNKHLKISTCLYKVWKNILWSPDTDDEYMAQILDYKEGSKPNDAPDSAASLFREAFNVNIDGASVGSVNIVY